MELATAENFQIVGKEPTKEIDANPARGEHVNCRAKRRLRTYVHLLLSLTSTALPPALILAPMSSRTLPWVVPLGISRPWGLGATPA